MQASARLGINRKAATMARKASISGPVEQVFLSNPGRVLTLNTIKKQAGIGNGQAISSAISYINKKARAGQGGIAIETVQRGKQWRYTPYTATTRKPAKTESEVLTPAEFGTKFHEMVEKLGPAELRENLSCSAGPINPLPASEPVVTLKVLGTLRETGEVLVHAGDDVLGPGEDSGVWAMRRLG